MSEIDIGRRMSEQDVRRVGPHLVALGLRRAAVVLLDAHGPGETGSLVVEHLDGVE